MRSAKCKVQNAKCEVPKKTLLSPILSLLANLSLKVRGEKIEARRKNTYILTSDVNDK